MPTRSFILDGTDERRFWDISWDGPEVEITSGKWGTNGRARSASFESPSERDAFVAAELKKILKKGYRESGDVAPAPDAATAPTARAVAQLARAIEAPLRAAWLPTFVAGDGGPQSFARVRGEMTLAPDEEWPRCPVCREPLTGLFELDRGALPSPALRDDSVAQLFWCEAWEARGDGDVCTASGGWLARLHARGPHRRAHSNTTGGTRGTGPSAIVGWTRSEELPADPAPDLRIALDENSTDELVEALLARVNATLSDEEDVYYTYVRALGKAARTGNKLDGWPVFVQQYDRPYARSLFQIEMNRPFDVNFGDLGAGHLLLTDKGRLDFYWSCH